MNHQGKDKQKRARGRLIIGSVILLILGLGIYLTHDILITNFLAYRICHSEPLPKTFIKKTVEYPESIYWEDNIYPGFNEKDRLLMIQNYLDGVHLKIMGLNAPDGNVYIFTATPEAWQKSREIKAGKRQGNYYDMLKEEAKAIAAKGQHVNHDKLPEFHYNVVFNPVPLTDFERRYLWSDEVVIKDNQSGEIIGFNRRLMHRWYMLNPDVALGNRYYYPHAMCGWSGYEFDDEVFPINKFNGMNHLQFVNNKLYQINGGKYGR
jgi:hypothetical protein